MTRDNVNPCQLWCRKLPNWRKQQTPCTSNGAMQQGGAMKPIKLVTPISGDPEAPTQNLVGLGALAAELAAEGISVRDLFARTGVDVAGLGEGRARISHRQRPRPY